MHQEQINGLLEPAMFSEFFNNRFAKKKFQNLNFLNFKMPG